MTSLKGFLPPAGSALWRKERRRLSSESEGASASPAIKHVVIREVWRKTYPSPHALYKIDVMTKSNHWFVFRRYREFGELHKKLVNLYGIPKDMLPPKKLTSKMAMSHLEQRKEALEHYLQRLVNSSTYVSSSPEIVEFLEVHRHDVMSVTKTMAKDLAKNGELILSSGESFTFTPTQLYCISRQLQLPEPTHAVDDAEAPDLGNLYDFVYQLRALCVSTIVNHSSACQELASHLEFDISLFKSLNCLIIDGCPLNLINEFSKIQPQLTKLTARYCLMAMKELLVDCVVEKRSAPKAKTSVESWRGLTTTRLTQNRVVVQPWHQLTHLNLTHNKLAAFDTSLKLLPVLQNLDMSYNAFVHLDLQQLCCPSLQYLNLSRNNIHFITGTLLELGHLKSLILSHNKLETVGGLGCLTGVIELDISHNQFRVVNEISKLCVISRMKYLSVAGNPFARVKPYRVVLLSYFKGRDIVLDKKPITQKERVKLKSYPTRLRTSSSPDYILGEGNEVEDCHTVPPRSRSYDLFGPPESDDDSGIEGTPSTCGNSAFVDQDGAGCVGSDLLFTWSYYNLENDSLGGDNSSHISSTSSVNSCPGSQFAGVESNEFVRLPVESTVGDCMVGEVDQCESTIAKSDSNNTEQEGRKESQQIDVRDHQIVSETVSNKAAVGSSQSNCVGGSHMNLDLSLQEDANTSTGIRTETCEKEDQANFPCEESITFCESTDCTDVNSELSQS